MVLSQQLGGTILHPLSFNMSLRVIIDTATCYCLLSSLKIWKSIGHQLTLFSFLPLPLLFFFCEETARGTVSFPRMPGELVAVLDSHTLSQPDP